MSDKAPDISNLRRDKLSAIIGEAHERLQGVLVDAGLDPAIARMIAAARVYHLLPASVRTTMATTETAIALRLAQLYLATKQAADAGAIASIPIE